jgi:type I restriction enzyme S subunit
VNGGLLTTTNRSLTEAGLRTGSTAVGPDTLIVSTRAPIGYVAQTNARTAFNQGCRGLTPRAALDVRFYRYVLSASPENLQSRGQGSTFVELSTESLASLPVPNPGLNQQRAIGDFLDGETARIDALISARTTQLKLVAERQSHALRLALEPYGVVLPEGSPSEVGQALPFGWRWIKLGSLLSQLTNGYVGPTRDILVDDGIRYIQGLHIKGGKIDFERRPFYVTREWFEQRPRISLLAGDVLIVQTGDIGQCAVVPDGFGEASCHALLIARPRPNLISPEYLGVYLQSEFGQAQLLRLATGALHPHLEFGIRTAEVVVPPRSVQSELVRRVRTANDWGGKVASLGQRNRALLREHRQALITAAVTGQLDLARDIAEEAS